MGIITRRNDIHEMTDLFERFFGPSFLQQVQRNAGDTKTELTLRDWIPAVDVEENNEAYVIHAELPQLKKEDIKLAIQNGVLTLSGERRQEKEDKGKKFHRVERSYGSFSRSFTLPENIDENGIIADYEAGMLNVRIPKSSAPKHDVRTIDIR